MTKDSTQSDQDKEMKFGTNLIKHSTIVAFITLGPKLVLVIVYDSRSIGCILKLLCMGYKIMKIITKQKNYNPTCEGQKVMLKTVYN